MFLHYVPKRKSHSASDGIISRKGKAVSMVLSHFYLICFYVEKSGFEPVNSMLQDRGDIGMRIFARV